LKSVGKFSHFTHSGKILFSAEEIPPIYQPVFTKKGVKVGTISDVIGNVKTPFVVVKPTVEVGGTLRKEIEKKGLFLTHENGTRRRNHGRKKGRVH